MSQSETWHSLFIRDEAAIPTVPEAVMAALLAALQQLGYSEYDPFPGGTGTPPGLTHLLKAFVTPRSGNWIRVVGDLIPDAVAEVSRQFPVIYGWLAHGEGDLTVYREGQIVAAGLTVYLRAGKTIADLERAHSGLGPVVADAPHGLLPSEVQQMARDHNVSADKANQMVDRITSRLFEKLDRASGGEASEMQSQAYALATGANRLDWNSAAGRQLKAMVAVLDLPDDWREPGFEAIRTAYQAARYLRKSANGRLMADEQAALKAIPNALEFHPLYVGK